MHTHLHTVEWNYDKEYSHDEYSYYKNKIDSRYVCEYKTVDGYEYYICSDIQTRNSLLGIYIGCYKTNVNERLNILVVDHDSEIEKTLTLNDERYLNDWE